MFSRLKACASTAACFPKTAPLFRDAAGRSLHPWPFGTYVVEEGEVWVASTYNRGSYDSRYMGPIRISQIRARLRSLMAPLIWFRVVAAGAIGMIAWRGQLWAIPLSIVVPYLIAVQPTRSAAGATSFAY